MNLLLNSLAKFYFIVLVVGLEVVILNEWDEPPGRAICNKLATGMYTIDEWY